MDQAQITKLLKASGGMLGSVPIIIDDATRQPQNPHFVGNGIEGTSPRTKKSLFRRKIKAGLSKAFGLAGVVGASAGTVVNVAKISKNVSSIVSSSIHLHRLHGMASRVKDGGSLAKTLGLLISIKAAKAQKRAFSTVQSAIPDIMGVSSIVGGVAGAIGVGVGTPAAALLKTAIDLHWQAYRELFFGSSDRFGGNGARGPAVDICRELVCLSASHITGKTETALDVGNLHSASELNEILKEPCGYLLLLLKLEQT